MTPKSVAATSIRATAASVVPSSIPCSFGRRKYAWPIVIAALATTSQLERVKQEYTQAAREILRRSMRGVARTKLTPDMLTLAGLALCVAGAVLVGFEDRNERLFFWLGGALFVAGSVADILDGALARAASKGTVFGAFLDSTFDRLGEAAMLAAIHWGLKQKLDPGAPVEGNGYEQAQNMGLTLPTNWPAAIDLFSRSERLKDYFGARFHHVYSAVKRAECDRFNARVTELDYAWYLRNA